MITFIMAVKVMIDQTPRAIMMVKYFRDSISPIASCMVSVAVAQRHLVMIPLRQYCITSGLLRNKRRNELYNRINLWRINHRLIKASNAHRIRNTAIVINTLLWSELVFAHIVVKDLVEYVWWIHKVKKNIWALAA